MDRHQLLFMNPTAKKELTEDDLTCVICSVLFIEPMTLNCAHIFCRLCLYKWLALKSTCPVCRRHVDEVLKSNEQLTSDIKQIMRTKSKAENMERERVTWMRVIEELKVLFKMTDRKNLTVISDYDGQSTEL